MTVTFDNKRNQTKVEELINAPTANKVFMSAAGDVLN